MLLALTTSKAGLDVKDLSQTKSLYILISLALTTSKTGLGMDNLSQTKSLYILISLALTTSKTGLDVDDRLPFSETYLNSWRRWICKVVRFSKMVPGFKQLCMEDQFNLLKCKGGGGLPQILLSSFSSSKLSSLHP